MTDADVVWNRACMNLGGGPGDRHLSALILAHGMVMNGGAHHAADVLEPAQIEAAAAACRYFGLEPLAALMAEFPAAERSDDEDERLSDLYHGLVPDDAVLVTAFEARYAVAPGDFDPVTERTFPRFGA